jgi:hypothetical protein
MLHQWQFRPVLKYLQLMPLIIGTSAQTATDAALMLTLIYGIHQLLLVKYATPIVIFALIF